LDAEELERLEIKEDHIILLEFFMTILKNIRKLLNTILNFYKSVKVLMIAMD